MKLFPRTKDTKTAGPHGKSLELREIPRRTVAVVHEHSISETTAGRFKKYGVVPNRANRRAYARGRGVAVPRATLVPYSKPRIPAKLAAPIPVF